MKRVAWHYMWILKRTISTKIKVRMQENCEAHKKYVNYGHYHPQNANSRKTVLKPVPRNQTISSEKTVFATYLYPYQY